MSDLQLSLLVIGVTIIGGVLVYNWAQERNFRRRLKQAFGDAPADILLQHDPGASTGGGRAEPKLPDAPVVPRAVHFTADITTPGPVSPPPAAAGMTFDDVLDYVAQVEVETPMSGAVIEELASKIAACGRPTRVVGFKPDSGAWEELARGSGGGCRGLQIGLQLVNRSGSVSAAQLAMFCDAVMSCADKASGRGVCPDAQAALRTARELDAFCARVDVAIGVNVISEEGIPFSGARIRGLAEAAGFQLEPDGVFHYRNEQRRTWFTLDNHEPAPFLPEQIKSLTTRGITLMLDVPRVEDGLAALERMLEIGQGLAAALGGRLVDDNRAGLTDAGVARIREQLVSIHDAMAARGMAAGGERALRLFS